MLSPLAVVWYSILTSHWDVLVSLCVLFTSVIVLTFVAPTDTPVLPDITHECIVLYALSRCKLQENDYGGFSLISKDVDFRLMQLSTMMDVGQRI